MRSHRWIVGLLGAFSFSLACCASLFFPGERAPSVRPESGLKFSHKAHADEATCLDCHGKATEGKEAGMPRKELCQTCHDEADHTKKENKDCYLCHVRPIKKPAWPRPALYEDITFSHAAHVKSEKDCAKCHGDVAGTTRIGQIVIPRKDEVCVQCHEADVSSADKCSLCHIKTRAGIKPADHGKSWKKVHGMVAREGFFDKKWYRCTYCHQESYCNTCHKHEEPSTHNETWRRGTHGLVAEVDRMQCRVCHQEDMCIRCHSMAPPYPRDATHIGLTGCSEECHRNAHRFGGEDCRNCHK